MDFYEHRSSDYLSKMADVVYDSQSTNTGDTFYSLAQRYGTTVGAIQAANPGVNPNRLQIGQTLCIPREIKKGSV